MGMIGKKLFCSHNYTRKKTNAGRLTIFTLKSFTALVSIIFFMQIINISAAGDPVLYSHTIIMIQGDDSQTLEVEPESQIMAIEYISFLIPWNETYVDTPLPKVSTSYNLNQVIWSDSMGWIRGEFSSYWNPGNPPYKEFLDMEDMECCIADFYAWGFPVNADRNLSVSTRVDTDPDFGQFLNATISDDVWNVSSSDLKLKPGSAFGEYISLITKMGINITNMELNWNASDDGENISFFISNNNGTNWLDMNGQKGELVNFTSLGNELIWKVNMTQDILQNNTPILDELWINVTYTPLYNDITLQLTYLLEENPASKKFEFVMDFYKDYADRPQLHIIIYGNKDYTFDPGGFPLVLYEMQTDFPDKNSYVYMDLGGTNVPDATITLQKVEEDEPTEFPMILLLIIILVGLILGIILLALSGKKDKMESEPTEDNEAIEDELETLGQRKVGLLKAIKKLDGDFEEGLLDEETYNELRDDYKGKTANVMEQMDVLSASLVAQNERAGEKEEYEDGSEAEEDESEDAEEIEDGISEERQALLQKKEKLLKSIKKLDSDFEEGLIDEDVYNDLRQSYKEKAVEVMKELDEG